MVFLFHMLVFAPLPGPISAVLAQGYLGVTFFFVLSGFVLTWSARPHVRVSTFYWRRFARIYPSHFVALLLAIPVFYTVAAIPPGSFLKPFDPAILSLSFLVIQGWWLAPAILFSGNPAAWTLTCEFFFYALHPWISKVLVPRGRQAALLIAGGVVLLAFSYRALVLAFPGSWLAEVPTPIVRLPEFVIGMALAWAIRSGWRVRVHPAIGVGSMAAVVLGIAVTARYFVSVPGLSLIHQFGNELFTVTCALAIVAIAQHTIDGKRSGFETRLQIKLGEWSFAFYLVHATFIYIAIRVFGTQPPSWLNLGWFVALLAVDLAAAWALHHFIERPFERRMRRWKDRKDADRLVAA
jgi:peptidoglycan/LPS O-acetylase OafA/YrhL